MSQRSQGLILPIAGVAIAAIAAAIGIAFTGNANRATPNALLGKWKRVDETCEGSGVAYRSIELLKNNVIIVEYIDVGVWVGGAGVGEYSMLDEQRMNVKFDEASPAHLLEFEISGDILSTNYRYPVIYQSGSFTTPAFDGGSWNCDYSKE